MRKKLKQPSFAKGVNRDDVTRGAEELGVDLNEHIAFVIGALRPIATAAGSTRLARRPAARCPRHSCMRPPTPASMACRG